MEAAIALPAGLRMMIVYALEIQAWDDETFRFLRKEVPPAILWNGQGAPCIPTGRRDLSAGPGHP